MEITGIKSFGGIGRGWNPHMKLHRKTYQPSPPGSIAPGDIVASSGSLASDLLSTSYLGIPHSPLFHHSFLLPLPSQLAFVPYSLASSGSCETTGVAIIQAM